MRETVAFLFSGLPSRPGPRVQTYPAGIPDPTGSSEDTVCRPPILAGAATYVLQLMRCNLFLKKCYTAPVERRCLAVWTETTLICC